MEQCIGRFSRPGLWSRPYWLVGLFSTRFNAAHCFRQTVFFLLLTFAHLVLICLFLSRNMI